MRAVRTITPNDVAAIRTACGKLADARDLLRKAGAARAAQYVGRALKSAEGAHRHADNVSHRRDA